MTSFSLFSSAKLSNKNITLFFLCLIFLTFHFSHEDNLASGGNEEEEEEVETKPSQSKPSPKKLESQNVGIRKVGKPNVDNGHLIMEIVSAVTGDFSEYGSNNIGMIYFFITISYSNKRRRRRLGEEKMKCVNAENVSPNKLTVSVNIKFICNSTKAGWDKTRLEGNEIKILQVDGKDIKDDYENQGLSGGAIAGICIACVIVVATIVLGFLFYRHSRNGGAAEVKNVETELRHQNVTHEKEITVTDREKLKGN